MYWVEVLSGAGRQKGRGQSANADCSHTAVAQCLGPTGIGGRPQSSPRTVCERMLFGRCARRLFWDADPLRTVRSIDRGQSATADCSQTVVGCRVRGARPPNSPRTVCETRLFAYCGRTLLWVAGSFRAGRKIVWGQSANAFCSQTTRSVFWAAGRSGPVREGVRGEPANADCSQTARRLFGVAGFFGGRPQSSRRAVCERVLLADCARTVLGRRGLGACPPRSPRAACERRLLVDCAQTVWGRQVPRGPSAT